MIDACEQHAAEFDILFNGSKSKLLFFKGRYASAITSGIKVNGAIVHTCVYLLIIFVILKNLLKPFVALM